MKHTILMCLLMFLINSTTYAASLQVQNNCRDLSINAYSFDCLSKGGSQDIPRGQAGYFSGLKEQCTYTLLAQQFIYLFPAPKVHIGPGNPNPTVILESTNSHCKCSGCD